MSEDAPESEAAVLHAYCTDSLFAAAYTLAPDQFADRSLQAIAEVLATTRALLGGEAGIVGALRDAGALERIGGPQTVFRLLHMTPAYGDVWLHAGVLAELHTMRELTHGLTVAVTEAQGSGSVATLLASATAALKLAQAATQAPALTVRDLFDAALRARGSDIRLDCGLGDLDLHTGGFRRGSVTVLGAETSFGKTAFGFYVANEALKSGLKPVYVSCEDSTEMCGRRLLGLRTRIGATALRDQVFTALESHQLTQAHEAAEAHPFYVNGIERSAEKIASDIRSICTAEGSELVIFDYLQKTFAATRTQDRRNEVSYIGRLLTDVIKTAGAAGLILSQVARPKEGTRPTMYSLKESGDVENGAETVLMGYFAGPERHIVVDKAKDGFRGGEFRLGWDHLSACFTGITPHGED